MVDQQDYFVLSETLPSHLVQTDLLKLFSRMGYQPVRASATASDPNAIPPLYYTSEYSFLFPPSTDNPNASKLNGIETTLDRAFGQEREILKTKEWLLFPIYEEWNYNWTPRKHWVLLAYCQSENQFYLLDPVGYKRGNYYSSNYKYLNEAIQTAFQSVLSEIKPFVPHYLELQGLLDSKSSGHWVAYCLLLFLSGERMEGFKALSKSASPLGLEEVKRRLLQLHHSASEAKFEADSSPSHSLVMHQLVVMPSNFEKRDYAIPTQETDEVASLLNGVSQTNVPQETGSLPQSGFGFSLNLYSVLLFSGAVTGLIALLCLASTTPILSATAATSMLVVGATLFFAGALGKCGIFGGGGASPNELGAPAVENTLR